MVLAAALAVSACDDAGRSTSGGSHGGGDDADGGGDEDAGAGDAGPDGSPAPDCPTGSRDGPPGATDGLSTVGGVSFNVRAPDDYDPERARGLIVAYAPSGGTAEFIETATGLTSDAMAAGHLIAYVDHVSPVDIPGAMDVAAVPSLVAEKWCVDPSRVYLTGSSDGASVIYTMLLNGYLEIAPAAIAPFAAGASGEELAKTDCLAGPLPVMVLHNADDAVFPGYGAGARDWWVACNGCDAAGGEPLANGCVPYTGCADGVEVQYCEGTGGHGGWPDLNASMIAFFDRFG
jgi:polyhydroxybutyrate depolymerase